MFFGWLPRLVMCPARAALASLDSDESAIKVVERVVFAVS